MSEEYLMIVHYKEDDDFICHSLAIDMLGCGSTKQEAYEECISAVRTHWYFCQKNKNFHLFYKMAPTEYFEKYGDQL